MALFGYILYIHVYTVYMYYVYRFINRMGFDQRKFQAQKATDSLVVFVSTIKFSWRPF